MHIKELRVAGFKSFVEPVRAPIEAGLTGVVGPNGCGKSNLLEAVRWVMGAASAKALRAGDMDDVIFAGADGRARREHAEVTLVLGGAEGRGPVPHAAAETLEVTRRIVREAGSTYRINGKEVRAKDVQMLFADASTGANSPALVRQGQISELIAAKPENRRRILEEAAGISGLHARRHEADLKLTAATATLERVELSAKEMDVQVGQLRRQARQAERYRALAEELRQLEALLLARRLTETRAAAVSAAAALQAAERASAAAETALAAARRGVETADAALPKLQEEEAIAAAVLRRLEGERVGLERDAAEAEAARARLEEDLARTEADARRAEADDAASAAAHTRLTAEQTALGPEATDVEAARAADAKAADAEAARAAAEATLEAAQGALARAETEAAAAAAHRRAAETALARARARLAEAGPAPPAMDPGPLAEASDRTVRAEAEAEAAAKRLEDAEARLAAAETAEAPARAAAQAALDRLRELTAEATALERMTAAPAGGYPAVLDALTVRPGRERALAAALGDDLAAALDPAAPAHWAGAAVAPLVWPAEVEPLAAAVTAPPALAARLAFCAVAPDAETAARLQPSLPPGARLVTAAGGLWRWDGFVRAAEAPTAAASRLEQKNRLAAVRADRAKAEAAHAKAKAQAEKAEAARSQALAAAREARAAQPKAASLARAAAAEAERLARTLAAAEQKAAAHAAQTAEAVRAVREAEVALAQLPPPPPAPDRTAFEAARAAALRARAEAAAATVDRQTAAQARTVRAARRTAIAAELKDWAQRGEDARARAEAAATRLEKLVAERAAVAARAPTLAAAHARLATDLKTAERRRAAAADAVAAGQLRQRQAHGQARGAEAEATRARSDVDTARAACAAAEAAQAEAEAQGHDLADLRRAAGPLAAGPLAEAPILDLEKRRERLLGEREAAGPVNLRAEQELAETLARAEALAREQADVEAAIAKLRQAIGRLNTQARTRLSTAFTAIDGHFRSLFETLFEGGTAALALTEAEDPLACGLEIRAAPPGKRLATLALMSGGEQALTATALIFAVFLANPAPICVLDEVDAPLDDANVERFCRLLDDMKRRTDTRFLVITHNPVTMARMDRLYGVTMAERGVSQLVSVDLQRAAELAAA